MSFTPHEADLNISKHNEGKKLSNTYIHIRIYMHFEIHTSIYVHTGIKNNTYIHIRIYMHFHIIKYKIVGSSTGRTSTEETE